MAISKATELPLTFSSHPRIKALISSSPSSSKIITFLSLYSSSKRQFLYVNSSVSLSSLSEEATTTATLTSNDLQSLKVDKNFQNSKKKKKPIQLDKEDLNGFLCSLCKDPRTEPLVFQLYQQAKKDRPEFRPNKLTFKLLIRYLLRHKKWDSISLLSQDFKDFRLFPDVSTSCKLLGSCIRGRKFKIAEFLLKIFETDGDIAVSAFNSAMKGYNTLHMYSRTIVMYNRMKLAGVLPDSLSYYQIMEAYQKTGNTEKVLSLFKEFQIRNFGSEKQFCTQIYSVLCASLGKSGRAFEALDFFKEMTSKGVTVNSSIYSSLICSFASIREAKVAEQLFEEAKEKGMVKDPALFLKLVLMYIEEGLLEKTLEVVESMKDIKLGVSDCILCAIINGYSKKRGLGAAAAVYEDLMITSGYEPGQVTYASIINVYCRLGLYSKAEMVFAEMENRGFVKCVVAYSNMVSMYGKTGRIRDAMKLVAKMKERGCEPNVWVYNSLMDMHGRVQNLRQVEKLWKEMKRRNIQPDKVSYTTVISAYSKAREFEGCMRFYEEYRINGGVIDRAMAGIMVGVFSKTSKIEELIKLLQDMRSDGTALDVRLYRSAMNAMIDAGFQVQAKRLEENFGPVNVSKIEPQRLPIKKRTIPNRFVQSVNGIKKLPG